MAIYPVYGSLRTLLQDSPRVSAILVTVRMLVILVWPAVLSGLLVENGEMVVNHLRDGTLKFSPPPQELETWPLIGKPLADI